MSITLEEKLYMPDDLLTMPDGDRYEVVHGKLVERNIGTESVGIGSQIFGLIWLFLGVRARRGHLRVFPNRTNALASPGCELHPLRPVAWERLPRGHCKIAPDLAVEVVSPKDTAEDVSDKVAEYQSVGVPLIWVVYPSTRRILVYRLKSSPEGRVSELNESDTITGEDVLPGFTCLVAKFFSLPRPQVNS